MTSIVAPIPSCSDADSKFVKEFWLKLKLIEDNEEVVVEEEEKEEKEEELHEESHNPDGEDDESELEDDDEFSFARAFGDGDIIPADEAFLNGQIRPVFPLFNRDLLLGEEGIQQLPQEGSYCEWGGKTESSSSETATEAALPEFVSKKSNSTGFSKLRRFRELVLRSNSDGKDKFVFLHHHHHHPSSSKGGPVPAAGDEGKKLASPPENKSAVKLVMKKKKGETTSAFEKMYARRKKEEGSKQRMSYLPYKQVGFFASVNGFSKNVHPY